MCYAIRKERLQKAGGDLRLGGNKTKCLISEEREKRGRKNLTMFSKEGDIKVSSGRTRSLTPDAPQDKH